MRPARASSKRRFHIRCDLEGVSGVVNLAQVEPGAPEYAEARRSFMAELCALIAGLRDGGAGEISIYDEHWFGRNVDLAQIPAGVTVHQGKPPYRADWPGGLVSTDSAMILHGLHSMAGTGAVLCHTYEPDFRAIYLNGMPVGEIGVETAIAGDWGVPLALVIADSAGAQEARALIPEVVTVETKISQSSTGAECFPLEDTLRWIRTAAKKVAVKLPNVKPLEVKGPVELLCAFNEGAYLDTLRRRAAARFANKNTLRLIGKNTTAVWAEYWQLKLAAQADLAELSRNTKMKKSKK
jgi:D-amino peptidase